MLTVFTGMTVTAGRAGTTSAAAARLTQADAKAATLLRRVAKVNNTKDITAAAAGSTTAVTATSAVATVRSSFGNVFFTS